MISATELADMRAVMGEFRTDTCQVLRKTSVSDNSGGTTDTWALVGSAFPCRPAPGWVPQREAILAGRPVAIAPWFVSVATTEDVRKDDTLAIVSASRGGYALNATGIRPPRLGVLDLEKVIEAVELS